MYTVLPTFAINIYQKIGIGTKYILRLFVVIRKQFDLKIQIMRLTFRQTIVRVQIL